MSRLRWLPILGVAFWLGVAHAAKAQTRPYIGFVYPAGGQQGTTFAVKLGGQGMDDVTEVVVTGKGVTGRVLDTYRRIGPQEIQLLREQVRDLKRSKTAKEPETQKLIDRIEKRITEWCNRPASQALAGLVFLEVTVAPDAQPGEREFRVKTLQGVSNPMVFYVGQVPEVTRKPMLTANYIVLGKEELALRRRPADEVEDRITLPCTANGQVASGEVNRYRFDARKGQRLVITTQARHLIPFLADAVPGWFQPVLTLYDADGKEVAYDDDYRFKPDPTILYEVPKDGEYVFAIRDSIYRGREDFVYRITVGELPFVTSIYPLGGRAGEPVNIKMKGWNLEQAEMTPIATDAGPGIHVLEARRNGFVSNPVPFELGTLPECFDKESNNTIKHAQKVSLPIMINGHIDRTDDWDVFEFEGRAGQTIAAEVDARRLDSPMDSVLKVTDANGQILALNDDHEDMGSGVNTHPADSYLTVKLPADGRYYVHLGDTARHGGEEYGYRLRISEAQPDFELRVVPSSVSLRSKSTASVSIYAIRKDGFTGPIKLELKGAPAGFKATPITLSGNQKVARLTVQTTLVDTKDPVSLNIVGSAKVQDRELAHRAVPAEDRMQAFLWRHLVPAAEFEAMVYNPSYRPPSNRPHRVPSPSELKAKLVNVSNTTSDKKPKFSRRQVAGRLRQIDGLYQEGLLTDAFTDSKVAECEASLAE